MTIIRDLANFTDDQLAEFGLSSVYKTTGGYNVVTRQGYCIMMQGHDSADQITTRINALKPPSSSDRIQKYGQFGTSI